MISHFILYCYTNIWLTFQKCKVSIFVCNLRNLANLTMFFILITMILEKTEPVRSPLVVSALCMVHEFFK